MNVAGHGIPSRERFRIELRPLCAADEAMYCGLYTDAETMAYIGPPLSAERAARSFHKILREVGENMRTYAIVEKSTGTAVGIGGWRTRQRRAEVGTMLIASDRNKRCSVEVVAALIDKAFAVLPIDAVWVQYDPANSAAKRLCDRLGMQSLDCEFSLPLRPGFIGRIVRHFEWQTI